MTETIWPTIVRTGTPAFSMISWMGLPNRLESWAASSIWSFLAPENVRLEYATPVQMTRN